MSNTKHTPGPWRLEYKNESNWQKSEFIGATIISDDECFEYDVAAIWNDVAEDQEEFKANARLIAAAPELLEALQMIANTFYGNNEKEWETIALEMRDVAENAILKATNPTQ